MGQFCAFYPKLRICMPKNAIWFCYSEVKQEIFLKQMFYQLFDMNFGKSFISWYFLHLGYIWTEMTQK